MSHSAECTRCSVPIDGTDTCRFCATYDGPPITDSRLTGAGRAARQLDRVSNLVELARADVEATVRNLDGDAPLLTVADLYAAAAHLRRAGELIDQAAELLEAAQ
ncbi:hypothetical protein MHAS_00888 [Mycolicibacterium hassiacum DSM 44199]|nr:hypothetical protein MHAS_00888 [Mycolicibacterium hassiacum DSM 44199]